MSSSLLVLNILALTLRKKSCKYSKYVQSQNYEAAGGVVINFGILWLRALIVPEPATLSWKPALSFQASWGATATYQTPNSNPKVLYKVGLENHDRNRAVYHIPDVYCPWYPALSLELYGEESVAELRR
jgi:hypothetical protein